MHFHYTDTTGLLGIVDTSALRATHLLFMNDQGELSHTNRLMMGIYEREMLAIDPPEASTLIALQRDFLHRIRYGLEHVPMDVYAVCFCENNDLLSQWRAYGDRGGGFSLGFDVTAILALAKTAFPECQVDAGAVIYRRQQQEKVVQDAYTHASEKLTRLAREDEGRDHDELANQCVAGFFDEVLRLAPFFKQDSFFEEQEWRVVIRGAVPRTQVKFRPHQLGPVPYVEIQFPRGDGGPLKAVRIGPTKQKEVVRRSLDLYFDTAGIEISSSEVTLR